MEYRRSEYMGDYSVDEVFEGTPKEILELMDGMDGMDGKDGNLIYDQEDAIEFIGGDLKYGMHSSRIRDILESEENYMRSIGIIKD